MNSLSGRVRCSSSGIVGVRRSGIDGHLSCLKIELKSSTFASCFLVAFNSVWAYGMSMMKEGNKMLNASLRKQIWSMNIEDLRDLNVLVVQTIRQMERDTARMFRKGDIVWFTTRDGRNVDGIVTKVNTKSVSLKAAGTGTIWRVTPSLLKLKDAA